MNKAARLAFMLAMLMCLGCSDSDRASLQYDLTGTWETVNAVCVDASPEDLDIPPDLPPEALEAIHELLSSAHLESELEGTVRFVQTGDMLEIFDSEEETEPFSGTVMGARLEYSLSQDELRIEGEGVVVSPGRLEITHTLTLDVGSVVSCQFDAVRL